MGGIGMMNRGLLTILFALATLPLAGCGTELPGTDAQSTRGQDAGVTVLEFSIAGEQLTIGVQGSPARNPPSISSGI